MSKNIKCAECRFPQAVTSKRKKKMQEYKCGNDRSEYHKSTLNVSRSGVMLDYIAWSGCGHGERLVVV